MIHHFRGFHVRGIQLRCCLIDLRSSEPFIDTVIVCLGGSGVFNVSLSSLNSIPIIRCMSQASLTSLPSTETIVNI